jgi:hypothetical protein
LDLEDVFVSSLIAFGIVPKVCGVETDSLAHERAKGRGRYLASPEGAARGSLVFRAKSGGRKYREM